MTGYSSCPSGSYLVLRSKIAKIMIRIRNSMKMTGYSSCPSGSYYALVFRSSKTFTFCTFQGTVHLEIPLCEHFTWQIHFYPSPIHCSTSRSIPHHTIYKIIYDTYLRRPIQRVDNYSQQHEDNGNELNQSIYSSIRSDGYPSIDPFNSKMDSKESAFY